MVVRMEWKQIKIKLCGANKQWGFQVGKKRIKDIFKLFIIMTYVKRVC